jgi:hypothetical protein
MPSCYHVTVIIRQSKLKEGINRIAPETAMNSIAVDVAEAERSSKVVHYH